MIRWHRPVHGAPVIPWARHQFQAAAFDHCVVGVDRVETTSFSYRETENGFVPGRHGVQVTNGQRKVMRPQIADRGKSGLAH